MSFKNKAHGLDIRIKEPNRSKEVALKMEHDFYEEEKNSSSKKLKRLGNKRERLQVKNYLKGLSSKDIINEEYEDDEDDLLYKD